MEERQRNWTPWIIAAAVLSVACACCLVLATLVAGGLLWVTPVQRSELDLGAGGKRSEWSYEVGAAPQLTIDNFAGNVTVRSGEAGSIAISAHKLGRRAGDLERIEVDIRRTNDGLAIKTRKPANLRDGWVHFEITVPADARLDARTGAGSVWVEGLSGGVRAGSGSGGMTFVGLPGGLDAETGSGTIDVRGAAGGVKVTTGSGRLRLQDVQGELEASTGTGAIAVAGTGGPVRLETGSGGIQYQGAPQGDCRFDTGSGEITLALPAAVNVEVDLHTGSGRIYVDHEVAGQTGTSKDTVKGTIGDGSDGRIRAETGSGNIRLEAR